MNFGFSDEQDELRAQARRFLDNECPLERVREIMKGDQPFDPALWKRIAELGWLGLSVPEADGGYGLRWEDVIILTEEMGRSLFPSPFIAHLGAQHAIVALADDAQRARWLPGLIDGAQVATVAVLEAVDLPAAEGIALAATADGDTVRLEGTKLFVPDGGSADLVVVAAREGDGVSLFVVPTDAGGLERTTLTHYDPTRRSCELAFEGVVVPAADRLGAAGAAWPVVADLWRRMGVAFAAETVGAASGALTLAVEYAKVREQFGSPIGRFQGVKHRCAEMHVDIESARSLALYASWAVDNAPDEAERSTAMAIAAAAEAADVAGEECIQIHGAIGYTWECDAHLYYKRGRYARLAYGAPDRHYERVLASQGL